MAGRAGRGDAVVLVHGLWGTDLGLRPLARRFRRDGLGVACFRYPSTTGRIGEIARQLREFVERTEGERVHLLGHSLGGIVIARMLASDPPAKAGRVALLGCPIRGSEAVERISKSRLGRRMMGPVAREGIVENRPPAPTGREVLVVAGTFPLGIGLLLGLPRPHDGWIRVSETPVEGARTVRSGAWHFGLLLSRGVAARISAFFRESAA